MFVKYDIIVVGAGHAGCEAAAAAAKLGAKTLLITSNMGTIAQMSCNPAMGGVAKGQIVREIDALGGYSGIVTDNTAIQFRMLNRSKGPAMWSPRVQSDRWLFAQEWRLHLESLENLDFWQETVSQIIVEDGRCVGVKTQMGQLIYAKSVVLTNGTFLNGLIHIGEKQFGGGRAAEKNTTGITEQLIGLGFEAGRMKTGTPPRVDGRSLDYSRMEEQCGDQLPEKFSYSPETKPLSKQKSCYITYTNLEVHQALKEGFASSPMFSGRIQGIGPRYCPSVEDKINRFADKDRHQIFVEPEGWNTVEVYVNGFSTSLPEYIQQKAMRLIPGFEKAKMFRPGYAIEYDFFPPTQLQNTLETKLIKNLYFAGQINGTTGYEEAACQGLMAGINAHLSNTNQPAFVLGRNQAYIGVLIDDLINKGTEEPYRMFTSRAEYRILLRQDNADLRLTPLAYALGLASEGRLEAVQTKQSQTNAIIKLIKETKLSPDVYNPWLESINQSSVKEKVSFENLLKRPGIDLQSLCSAFEATKDLLANFDTQAIEQAEILTKYESYIEKESFMAQKMQDLENLSIRLDFEYERLGAVSSEAREKFKKIRPATIGQASRISGVSPSDISILIAYMQK